MERDILIIESSERLKWIDVLKGITICVVVFGHVLSGFNAAGFKYNNVIEINLVKVINIFQMPLFFAISGYVFVMAYLRFQDRGEIKLTRTRQYRDQIYNLLFLYFIYSILMFGVKYVAGSNVNVQPEWIDLLKLPIISISSTPYWYLYILAVLYILTGLYFRRNWNSNFVLKISFILCILYSVFESKEIILVQRAIYYRFFF